MRTIINGLLVAALLLVGPAAARGAADEYERSIRAFLKDNFDQKPECMVVGLIDADGVRIYSAGNLGEGKDRPADGDTLFEIGSCTKTFTALLLLEMAERGEVKLDDPVAELLDAGQFRDVLRSLAELLGEPREQRRLVRLGDDFAVRLSVQPVDGLDVVGGEDERYDRLIVARQPPPHHDVEPRGCLPLVGFDERPPIGQFPTPVRRAAT